MRAFPFISAVFLAASLQTARAGSATWNVNPISNNWNVAGNWTPATIPNSATDVATFDVSNISSITPQFQSENYLAEMVFNPGASAYTFNISEQELLFWGAGVINNSGVTQTFLISQGHFLEFFGTGTGGNNVDYTVNSSGNGGLTFIDNANAGSATYTLVTPADLRFTSKTSAADGMFENQGGTAAGQAGGTIYFESFATAGNATITNEGGTVAGALGATTVFWNVATGGNATILARGGSPGTGGGLIQFLAGSDGGKARIELFDRGTLDISPVLHGSVNIGSVEGNGHVLLGDKELKVGGNNLSTRFTGTISGGDSSSMVKVGGARLVLSGANTYTGATTVRGGTLAANNRVGSATGTGPVTVEAGVLVGTGFIAGPTEIGTGGARMPRFSPGTNGGIGTLTFLDTVTFNSDAYFAFDFNSTLGTADQVVANGVTTNGTFAMSDHGSGTLAAGTTFKVINNTAATPIGGTFTNLAQGSTVIIGNNTFQANYEGGDANDLTLTVIP
jgi:autotransporter-associated beta strand protein